MRSHPATLLFAHVFSTQFSFSLQRYYRYFILRDAGERNHAENGGMQAQAVHGRDLTRLPVALVMRAALAADAGNSKTGSHNPSAEGGRGGGREGGWEERRESVWRRT